MPHFLNRKESQLRSSDHIKKIAFPTAQGSYVAVLSVWELGLLSAKKIEYFDWKILLGHLFWLIAPVNGVIENLLS